MVNTSSKKLTSPKLPGKLVLLPRDSTYGKADPKFPNAVSHWLHGSIESGLMHTQMQMENPENYLRVDLQPHLDMLKALYIYAPSKHWCGRISREKDCLSPVTRRKANITVVIQQYERLTLAAIERSLEVEKVLNIGCELRTALTGAAKMKHLAEFRDYAAILNPDDRNPPPFVRTAFNDGVVASARGVIIAVEKEASLKLHNADTDTPILTALARFCDEIPHFFESTDDMTHMIRMYSIRNSNVPTQAKELADAGNIQKLWENLLHTYRRLLFIRLQDVATDDPDITDNLELHAAGQRVL